MVFHQGESYWAIPCMGGQERKLVTVTARRGGRVSFAKPNPMEVSWCSEFDGREVARVRDGDGEYTVSSAARRVPFLSRMAPRAASTVFVVAIEAAPGVERYSSAWTAERLYMENIIRAARAARIRARKAILEDFSVLSIAMDLPFRRALRYPERYSKRGWQRGRRPPSV